MVGDGLAEGAELAGALQGLAEPQRLLRRRVVQPLQLVLVLVLSVMGLGWGSEIHDTEDSGIIVSFLFFKCTLHTHNQPNSSNATTSNDNYDERTFCMVRSTSSTARYVSHKNFSHGT